MTETERITNAVYDKHMQPEYMRLGQFAAECELWAAQPETPLWEKPILKDRAQKYRDAQFDLLAETGPSVCETHADAIAWFEHRQIVERLEAGETIQLCPRRYQTDLDGSKARQHDPNVTIGLLIGGAIIGFAGVVVLVTMLVERLMQ